jgi:signal transduction histidine kinase
VIRALRFMALGGARMNSVDSWADEALARQRRQLARDLHDGLCQDLAFIASHASRLAGEAGEDHPVVVAARRALATARGTLAELSAAEAPDLTHALRRVAEELAGRFRIAVEVRAEPMDVDPEDREDIVRIAREAIVNAAKHGDARHVRVEFLRRHEGLVLRVSDDGSGIEPASTRIEGFGMTSMRERAASLGASLHAGSTPDGGTELELVVAS